MNHTTDVEATMWFPPNPTRLGRTVSIALSGMRGHVVEIEADIGQTLPGFTLLGLPDQSLQEARDRLKSAARNSGLPLTRRHLTINLTPASLHKKGPMFDLGIVMAAYAAEGHITGETGPVFLAALGLDGRLRHAPGILPSVMAAVEYGFTEFVVAEESVAEAELVPHAKVRSFTYLHEVIEDFGGTPGTRTAASSTERTLEVREIIDLGHTHAQEISLPDMADISGQYEARYGLEVAAAGGHNMLLEGAPGAGKTMLAERLPGLLPVLDDKTALEVTSIRSMLNPAHATEVCYQPPFQAPHHAVTMAALLGGGSGLAQPGAVSLAHGGVLFLDEAAEFDRKVLDALRQPLEDGSVTLHRARGALTYPARFQLIIATNPCPCGWADADGRRCTCTSLQRRRYASKLSGPLLDRVDVQIKVSSVTSNQFNSGGDGESSAEIVQRVKTARTRQQQRWEDWGYRNNAEVSGSVLQSPKFRPSKKARAMLDRALDAGAVTLRGYARTLRLSWTIADLNKVDQPGADEIDIALFLRTQRDSEH